MTIDTFFLARDIQSKPIFDDLSAVKSLVDSTSDDNDFIPAGSIGTIIGVSPDGDAYTVEFDTPDGAVATLLAKDLMPVPTA